jgi:GTP-binding protein
MNHSKISAVLKSFRGEIKFVAGASKISQLPKLFLPQIVFVGKSNVGKSSLINLICGRKALARVSHTPGRTQQINFFSIEEKFILADLPGYGYAKVSLTQKEYWEKLITYYLFNTDKIALVNILIDSRRGLKDHDISVIDLIMEHGHLVQIVCTKGDEIKNHDSLKNEIMGFMQLRYKKEVNIIFTSVRNKMGANELQKSIVEAAVNHKLHPEEPGI